MELKLNNQFTNLSIKEMDEVNGGLALGWYIVGGVVLVGLGLFNGYNDTK